MSTFTNSGEEFPMPTGDWKDKSAEDAYPELRKIEDAFWADDNEAVQQKLLTKHGFISKEQFEEYQSFILDKVDFTKVAQKNITDAVAAQRKTLNDSAAAMAGTEIMTPIAGVSLEMYASINAQLAQGKDYNEILKKHGIETVSWEKASEGWNNRMRTDTTFTVTNEYSKFFLAAGQGQFGETSKEAAKGIKGEKVDSENPISLELYVEIMAAQSAAASQGKDANQVLASYGLNAADWGAIGIHWANKMMSDMNVGMKFGELFTKATEKFSAEAPKAGSDIDF